MLILQKQIFKFFVYGTTLGAYFKQEYFSLT